MTSHARRLASGGRIDRDSPLSFAFDGRAMQGFAGDTLASALLANGVDVVARSFKYGRPRGVVGHGAEEPNAIVGIGSGAASVPNQRATQVELVEGLCAEGVRSSPYKRLAAAFAGLLPAGFYYKTFMASKRLWAAAEHGLRQTTGLGSVPGGTDPDRYQTVNQHCDVLVAGAGPAGLMAALAAARAGARVLLADEQSEMGGSLLASPLAFGGAEQWLADALAELQSHPQVLLLPRSTVFGYYDHNFLAVVERCSDHLPSVVGQAPRQRLHRVRAKQTVLATGAVERPLVFAGNDIPGVMLASSVAAYLHRYAVAAGERLLLFTCNDGAYGVALDWLAAGREVAAIVDSRAEPGACASRARAAGIDVVAGHGVIEALGGKRVQGALLAPLNADATRLDGPPRRIECDLVASSGGWNPTLHLSSQAGARPVWSKRAVAFMPGEPRQATRSVGAAAGTFAIGDCLRQGAEAGAKAAALAGCGDGRVAVDLPDAEAPEEQAAQALFLVPHCRPVSRAPRQFVDLQLDVTAADIELAVREGYRSVEHVKRYTALGFGTDQGKLGNVNGVAILAAASGRSIAETGTTVFRPAYTPATFGAIAGRDVGDLFDPERHTAMHAWHLREGAAWENVSRWKRPWYYPKPGEPMRDAVARECLAARNGVGLLDASTLGKIDIQGRDAALFLDRIYTGGFRRLGIGRCRYGLMLREDGTIFDDGVAAQLLANRYLMHTTTGNAEAVYAWLERWLQTEWPHLDVQLASVTDHWATAALVGPKSRAVLGKLCDLDLSNEAFPFMSVREGAVGGVAARVFRISFSGELSYEVNVSARHGERVWEALMAAGEEFGITPYGTETMHVLRAEKGFIIVGQDTDGSMTPDDMGLGWAVRQGKPFGFIGDRSLEIADHRRGDRLQLVGLQSVDGASALAEGAAVVASADPPASTLGHVTSSYFSAALNRPIALAMVKNGRGRLGETVYCPRPGAGSVAARLVDPVFYDPEGRRMRD